MRKAKQMQRPWISKSRPAGVEEYRSHDNYHTSRWTKASKVFKANHPICAECYRRGLIVPAEVTDHIIPWPVCEDFWDEKNWQSLCKRCNHDKGQRDKKLIQKYKLEKTERK